MWEKQKKMYPERKIDKLLLGFPFESSIECVAVSYLFFLKEILFEDDCRIFSRSCYEMHLKMNNGFSMVVDYYLIIIRHNQIF